MSQRSIQRNRHKRNQKLRDARFRRTAKHHVCKPGPLDLGQAYPRCRVCGRALKDVPEALVLMGLKKELARQAAQVLLTGNSNGNG